jgi:hypothetical protein
MGGQAADPIIRLLLRRFASRFAPPCPNFRTGSSASSGAAAFAHLAAEEIASALLIRYDSGAGVGWDKDGSTFEHAIGISGVSPENPTMSRRRLPYALGSDE